MLRPISVQRLTNILFFIILVSAILYFGREFFILIVFAGFLAMLMTPLSNRLEGMRFPRVFSSLISVLIIIVVISAVLVLLSSQIISVIQDIPRIKSEFDELVISIQSWVYREFDASIEKQMINVKEHAADAMNSGAGFLAGAVKGTFGFLGKTLVVMVFTFLFLLHREKYEDFVVILHKPDKRDESREMIDKITRISEQYLTGRLVAVIILAIVYIIGLTVIGVKNAIVLALIAALISFIPYVGSIIGGLVPLLMSFVEGTLYQALGIIIVMVLVNIISHYLVEPYIVGGSVNISPFFTILSLIVGGILWGLAGIILFLPMLGVLKLIFENIQGLQPYAYLIGDQDDSSVHEKLWLKLKEWFSKK